MSMHCVFVQIRCRPGTTYQVATSIVDLEKHSEIYSTSGEYDLLVKLYLPKDADIGHEIDYLAKGIDGIERTLTIITFKAF